MMKDYVGELQAYRDREIEAINKIDLDEVNKVMNVLEIARLSGKNIYICGNGGSAATASHYAVDFNKGVNLGLLGIDGHEIDSVPLAEKLKNSSVLLYNFECLSDNIPTMTAEANDESYQEIFRFPLAVKMKTGDVVIGISGSGNSPNVINALEFANKNGGITIAVVGYDGGKMKEIADHYIHIDVDDMQISEDIHMILDHMMMSVLCK